MEKVLPPFEYEALILFPESKPHMRKKIKEILMVQDHQV
jgi:hypothetical protein